MNRFLRPSLDWNELMADPSNDAVGDLAQSGKGRSNGLLVDHRVRGIVENYAELDWALSLHVRIGSVGHNASDASHGRVLFQRLSEVQLSALVTDDSACLAEGQLASLGDNGGWVYYPVFVGVGQLAEDGEFVVGGEIPSLVRLVLVEPAEVGIAKKLPDAGVSEALWRIRNRELDRFRFFLRRLSSKVEKRKLPHDVIEGRTKVVDDLPDKDAPFQDGEPPAEAGRVERYLRSLRVVLAPDAVQVRLEEPLDLFVEGIQLLKGPCGLGMGSVERWHGGDLTTKGPITQGPPPVFRQTLLEHPNIGAYDEWAGDYELQVLEGSSQDPAIMEAIRRLGPYDWIFVDGDHRPEPAMSDVLLGVECAAPGALLLIHDIADCYVFETAEWTTGPHDAFVAAGEGRETWTYVDPGEHRWGHGIGVIQL